MTRTRSSPSSSRRPRASPGGGRGLVPDAYGFTLSFKGVLLEGLEVVFIVLTFGSNQHDIGLAAVAAACAVAVVAAAGVAVRAPLARVPENTMKFVVGIMLTAFGTFWGAEGAGAHWPGSDAALLVLVPAVGAFALRAGRAAARPAVRRAPGGSPAWPRAWPRTGADVAARIRAFAAFCYDFVVGDDWRGAAVVAAALAVTAILATGPASPPGG